MNLAIKAYFVESINYILLDDFVKLKKYYESESEEDLIKKKQSSNK